MNIGAWIEGSLIGVVVALLATVVIIGVGCACGMLVMALVEQ